MFLQTLKLKLIVPGLLCAIWAVGCQTPDTRTAVHVDDADCIAAIDSLAEQVNRPHPHPYRKPVRDARVRAMRLIAVEVSHLLDRPSAEALTGGAASELSPAEEKALADLREAAERNDSLGVSLAYHQWKEIE